MEADGRHSYDAARVWCSAKRPGMFRS